MVGRSRKRLRATSDKMDDKKRVAKLDLETETFNQWALVVVPLGGKAVLVMPLPLLATSYSIVLKPRL